MKKIFLSNGQVTLVSDEDHIFLAGYPWCVSGGYVRAWVNYRIQYIHRVIIERMGLDLSKGEVDHIDGDPLNNQRNNLRVATRSQNQANSKISKNNTSGFKGVYWHDQNQKWLARIMFNGQRVHLGYFDTPEEAHEAYRKASEKYFGEFAGVKS